MCTAVVGGSIHRAATRISTASDQRSATPMRNHRTKDRRVPFRSGVFEGISGFSITLQNNRLGWIEIAPAYHGSRVTGHVELGICTCPISAVDWETTVNSNDFPSALNFILFLSSVAAAGSWRFCCGAWRPGLGLGVECLRGSRSSRSLPLHG